MENKELREIFVAEAMEAQQDLDRLFTELEKDTDDMSVINEIFRITHTLKANAAAMGFVPIARISHTIEDVFSEIRSTTIKINASIFKDLFRANDVLSSMISGVNDESYKAVKYRGIQTKLNVLIRRAKEGQDSWPKRLEGVGDVQESSTSDETTVEEKENIENSIPANTEEQEIQGEEEIPTVEATEDDVIEEEKDDDGKKENAQVSFSDIVQIPVRKLDVLMNLVGELIIERDRIITSLNQVSSNSEFARLQRITSELQYSVMDVRLVQVGVLFHKFHRIVRDTAQLESKKVNLKLEGTESEMDRNVMQTISESLVHVVRNAISHGIETPVERKKKGKSEYGEVVISARTEKDTVVIEVKDNGNGIDANIIKKKAIEKGLVQAEFADRLSEDEIIMFIFEPGFSSVDQVTAVSEEGLEWML